MRDKLSESVKEFDAILKPNGRVVFLGTVFAVRVSLTARPVSAQELPQATDVTSADIQKFINDLPRDAVSDRPIRIVNVTGNYQVGVWGVFRPK